MQAVIERHVTAGPDLQYKLEQSRKLAESQELRTIRCPSCGALLEFEAAEEETEADA